MKQTILFTVKRQVAWICGAGALALLAGCADSPKWGAWSLRPTPEEVQAKIGVRPETFIYFTRYEVYRQPRSRHYVYQEGGAWVRSERPPTVVPEQDLLASPSVNLTLGEEPERGHEATKRAHPSDQTAPSVVLAGIQ